jgi:peptidoglycan hydrolase CwlO-like protein
MPASPGKNQKRGARRGTLVLAALTLCLLTALVAVVARAPAQSATDELEGKFDELESNIDRQGSLQEQIDAQNREINDLIAKESELRRKETAVQTELDRRQGELDKANKELNAEKAHLAEVRARLQRALDSLEQLLVEIYKTSEPDTLSIVLESASWEDLLTEAEYLERVQNYDEAVVERVSGLREEIEELVVSLRETQERIKVARDEVAGRRAELAKTRGELDAQHAELVSARQARQSNLAALQAREEDLEEDLGTSIPGPGETARLVGQTAIAPPNAPLVVKAVIEAANEISDKPYIWGGGHGSFEDDGYDCSGAISYALHGGGLLDSPLDSTGFTVWGEPGAGSWITVYGYSGHAYAVIAGLRWDTGGPGGGNGPRWSTTQRSPSGFVARHPAGF